MMSKKEIDISTGSLGEVHDLMLDCVRSSSLAPIIDEISGSIGGGKMLRAGLCLKVGTVCGTSHDTLIRSAAAVEMIHAASLLHDDVIDDGYLRRGAPTFWSKKGVSGAILLGDLLVCKAMQLLIGKKESRQGGLLVNLVGVMCDAEVEQELITRGTIIDLEKCTSLARRKTGSLFAFAAAAGDSCDGDRSDALMEAGYRLGTAYQLADDLLDASGAAVGDGKELGKDAIRGTAMFVLKTSNTDASARLLIDDLCRSSSELLAPWPELKNVFDEYLNSNFAPVVSRFVR